MFFKSLSDACNLLAVDPTSLYMYFSSPQRFACAICIARPFYRYSFLSFFLFVSAGLTQAQSDQAWPVRVSIFDESLTIASPSTFSYPFNPAFGIGTTYTLNSKKRAAKEKMPKGSWFLLGEFGGYHHQYVRSAFTLTSGIGYRRQFGRLGLALDFGPGLSYAFTPEETYRYEDGIYKEVTDWGALGLHVATSFSASWQLKKVDKSPEVSLIIRQSIEDPFRNISLPHLYVGAGFTFYPFAE